MNRVADTFNGVNIYIDHNCMAITIIPVKIHHAKNWMTESYKNRIQKKWIKRFGYKKEPCMYQTPRGFIMHPEIYARFKELN